MSARPAPPPASAVALRPMRAEDVPAVMAVETRAYQFPWTPGIFLDCIKAGHACWLLEQDGEPIAHAVLSVAADEAHVLNLCVAPELQGRGHGGRLLKRLIDAARWHRVERVFLEVRPSNTIAIGLYQRAGFNEIGIRPGYYPTRHGREDAIVMARELLPPETA